MAATFAAPQGAEGHTEPGLQASWHFSCALQHACSWLIRVAPRHAVELDFACTCRAVQRSLDRRPELFDRLAADRQPDEARRHRVAPAGAPFGRGVDAAEGGGRLDQGAAVDEVPRPSHPWRASRPIRKPKRSICTRARLCDGSSSRPGKRTALTVGMLLQPPRDDFGGTAHAVEAHLQRLQPAMHQPGFERAGNGAGQLSPFLDCRDDFRSRLATWPNSASEWPLGALVSAATTMSAPSRAAAGRRASSSCCRQRRARRRRARLSTTAAMSQMSRPGLARRLDEDEAIAVEAAVEIGRRRPQCRYGCRAASGNARPARASCSSRPTAEGCGRRTSAGSKKTAEIAAMPDGKATAGAFFEMRQQRLDGIPGRIAEAAILVEAGGSPGRWNIAAMVSGNGTGSPLFSSARADGQDRGAGVNWRHFGSIRDDTGYARTRRAGVGRRSVLAAEHDGFDAIHPALGFRAAAALSARSMNPMLRDPPVIVSPREKQN